MSSHQIHSMAFVDPKAELARNVAVGPHCCIGAGVVLGDGCIVHNNVTIIGRTTCGRGNVFFPGSVVGAPPQDLKYKGGDTRVEVGDDNVFRENVTVHAGTEVSHGVTRIGSHNRFLVGVHVAHDCTIEDECILSNYVQLAGHVHLESRVTMGGMAGVHHFTTVGTLAYVAGLSGVRSDAPPFMIVDGNPARPRGFNETGMRRWGYTEGQVKAVREAFRVLFSQRADEYGPAILDRLEHLERDPDLDGEVRYLCESVRRSLHQGVYGRHLEQERRDTDADRRAFYGHARDADTPGDAS